MATPILNDITQCQFASDNRTMIYRIYTAGRITQQAYVVDSLVPATPQLLAPAGEAGSKQGLWHTAKSSMRIAVLYFNNNGVPSTAGQAGRFYSIPLGGGGDPFLFSDTFETTGSMPFFASSADGSFLLYQRQQAGIQALELMSTHGLNLSIPLSGTGETIGVRSARWLRKYP